MRHAMHPLAGQGLNVGLADVAELVRVLTTALLAQRGRHRLLRQLRTRPQGRFRPHGARPMTHSTATFTNPSTTVCMPYATGA